MVRVYTFLGLCMSTYLGVKALDNLVVWMAERRDANMDNIRLEREAKQLKQQLLKEIQEKQATIRDKVPEKHHVQSDKNFKLVHEHLKPQNEDEKLPRKQEVQQDTKVFSRHLEDAEKPKVSSSHLKDAKTPIQNEESGDHQPQDCPGEVIAECTECGETFLVEEPHSPSQNRKTDEK